MSKLETNTIDTISGSTNLTLGGTNATDITIPSGVTITNNGTQSGFGGTNTPNFLAYRNASLNLSSSTETTIIYDAEDYDTASNYDTSTGIFTPTTAGKYLVIASIGGYTTASFSEFRVGIKLNNTTLLSQTRLVNNTFPDGNSDRIMTSCVAELNGSTDNLRVTALQNSGTNMVINTEYLTSFTAYKIIE